VDDRRIMSLTSDIAGGNAQPGIEIAIKSEADQPEQPFIILCLTTQNLLSIFSPHHKTYQGGNNEEDCFRSGSSGRDQFCSAGYIRKRR
jgi:hypothetical protein